MSDFFMKNNAYSTLGRHNVKLLRRQGQIDFVC